MTQAAEPLPGWRPGLLLWPDSRTKVVGFAGIGSRSGDVASKFAGLMGYLSQHGYRPQRDFLEGTYNGRADDSGQWTPRAYAPPDTRQSLSLSAEAAAGVLDWYRERLPAETRLCVVGFSLGGVVALDGATLAVARDRAAWRGRLAGVVTLSAPVLGCNAGPLINWAWLGTSDLDPLGAAGSDLDRRWTDPDERLRVARRAAFLRAHGARVLTLTDPDDVVVRPDEALLPAPGEAADDLLLQAVRIRPVSFGHGALLDEPRVWRRVLEVAGPQEVLEGWSATDTAAAEAAAEERRRQAAIEDELQAIKSRLRAQGRIPT